LWFSYAVQKYLNHQCINNIQRKQRLYHRTQKTFNQEATQSLTIQIGNEVQKKQTSSYKSDGKASSYTLNLSVPIKVFNNDNKLLLSKNLNASIHLSKMSATQADRLQIEENYEQLRNTIIKKLLRRLSKLNEN